jgi:hypothetical protein
VSEIDAERLWRTLGGLENEAKAAREHRSELIRKVEALSDAQTLQRRDHDRLVNRGYGAILGIGAIAGSVGAAIKSFFWGSP